MDESLSNDDNADRSFQAVEGRLLSLEGEIAGYKKDLVRYQEFRERASEIGLHEEQLESFADQRVTLVREGVTLQQEINAIQERWINYRKERRVALRGRMRGKKLGKFVLSTGKAYEDVVIKEVDDVGIKIIHRAGSARIPASDLPAEMRAALDLDLLEAEEALKKSQRVAAARSKAIDVQRQKLSEEREQHEAIAEQNDVKNSIPFMMTRISQLEQKKTAALREASVARSRARHSRDRSGPDGLETWDQRAARHENLADKYAKKIAALALKVELKREAELKEAE